MFSIDTVSNSDRDGTLRHCVVLVNFLPKFFTLFVICEDEYVHMFLEILIANTGMVINPTNNATSVHAGLSPVSVANKFQLGGVTN